MKAEIRVNNTTHHNEYSETMVIFNLCHFKFLTNLTNNCLKKCLLESLSILKTIVYYFSTTVTSQPLQDK